MSQGRLQMNKPLCLLSLGMGYKAEEDHFVIADAITDGGGIRGFSELIILEEIMERIKWKENLDRVPIPADRFNLIGGTSTGGLIAILLGRLRLSAADAIKVYEELAGDVFSQQKWKVKDGKYRATKLEEAIKKVVASELGPELINARMFEKTAHSHKCGAFVCAVGTSDVTHPAGPTLFRTYEVEKNKEYNCKIWEAARATSAAPTFFKGIEIGPSGSAIGYVDAGLGCNNPIKQVLDEAALVFGDRAPVSCVLSIGTGQAGPAELGQPCCLQRVIPVDLIRALGKIATDSGKTAEEMERKHSNSQIYHRLNVDRGMDSVYLDEWKRLGVVRARTKNYLKQKHVSGRVDKVVDALSKPYKAPTQALSFLVGRVPAASGIFYSNRPQRMVNHYVLRRSLLRDVKGRLFGESGSARVVLHGMGGSGKTQLAFECCQHAEETLRFMATLWIDASSPESVVQSYKDIASCISDGLPVDNDGKTTVSAVQKTLRDWERRWLVVFDNYDDLTAFNDQPISDYIPQGTHGSILFTSRHHDSRRLGHLIKVLDMTEEESVELLLHKSSFSIEERAQASEIAIMLGRLPLALDQAAAYMGSHRLSLQNFVSEYNARKQVVLREIPDQWEYRKKLPDSEKEQDLGVFTTWEMSFGMVRGPEATKRAKHRLLTLAAFFDNKLISERYFRAYCDETNARWMDFLRTEKKWDSRKFGDMLAECGKLSLLQLPDRQTDELRFSIHPLVSEWLKYCKKQIEPRELVLETCEVLCAYLDPFEVYDLPLQIRQETLSHIDACTLNEKNFCERALDAHFRNCPFSAFCFAKFYYAECRYSQAARLCEQIFLAAEEEIGFEHLWTLKAAEFLADTYAALDAHCKAEKLYMRVLSGYENELGTEHFSRARVTTSLARVLTNQARWNEAELLYSRALAVTNNPDESRAVQYLAVWHRDQGRYHDAENLYKRTLAVEEMKLDLEHPNILRIKYGLAINYCCQGRYDEMERLLKEVIAGYKRKFGTKHRLTQDALEDLEICQRFMAQTRAKGYVHPLKRGSHPRRGTSRTVDVQGGSKTQWLSSERIQGRRRQRVFGRCLGDHKD